MRSELREGTDLKGSKADHRPDAKHVSIGVQVHLHVELEGIDSLQLIKAGPAGAAAARQQRSLGAGQRVPQVPPQLRPDSQSLLCAAYVLLPQLHQLLPLLVCQARQFLQPPSESQPPGAHTHTHTHTRAQLGGKHNRVLMTKQWASREQACR